MGDGRGTLTRETTTMDADTLASQVDVLQERIAELEFMQDDDGWEDLSGESSTELSRFAYASLIIQLPRSRYCCGRAKYSSTT